MSRKPLDGFVPGLAAALLAAFLAGGCGTTSRPQLYAPAAAPAKANGPTQLKVHMRSGELYVLAEWRVTGGGTHVEGVGRRYSAAERRPEGESRLQIPVEEVALFQTERPEDALSGGAAALAVMTTVTGLTTGYCLANPKACFGSCPTFYLDDHADRPDAEGFSESIARALEARDVDALYAGRPGREERLVMTVRNEALETHAIRRVRLLVAPRPPDGRVLASPDGRFHEATDLHPPAACAAPEGDCAAAVRAWDGEERASLADGADLAAREMLELRFAVAAPGRLGLVLGGRQTLLSTFLFYQTMAYFGRSAGTFLAALERDPSQAPRALGMARVLGGIEVEVDDGDGAFRAIGAFDEAGPIAGDVQVLPLTASRAGVLRVRLRMAKGHWRLDYAALARLGRVVEPAIVEPVAVETAGRPDAHALATLRSGDRHLVAMPGHVAQLAFPLPRPARELELFLESQGYYYEWMREEWLAEEDPSLALLALADPAESLRRLAGPFKSQEDRMERTFWSSRFRR